MKPIRLKSLLPWLLPVTLQFAFLFHTLSTGHTHTQDSHEYLLQAENIFHDFTFYCGNLQEPVKDVSLYSRRPPGYGLFVLITSFFLHWTSLTLIIQSFLSVFNLYLGYRILKIVLPGFRNIWLYLIPASLIPSQFALGAMYMAETPFQTTILLSIWFLKRYQQPEGKNNDLLALHFCLLLSYLIKPAAILLWLCVVIYQLIFEKGTRSTLRLAVISAFHLLIIGGMMARNYHLTGVAEFSSIGHKLLLNYNIPALLNAAYDEKTSLNILETLQTEMSKEPYPVQTAMSDQFIREQIQDHFPDYLLVHLKGMINFFTDGGRWELEHIFNDDREQTGKISWAQSIRSQDLSAIRSITSSWPVWVLPYYLLSVITTLICLTGCIFWLFQKYSSRSTRILFAGVLLYFAVITGPSASARFRMPVHLITVITTLIVLQAKNRDAKMLRQDSR